MDNFTENTTEKRVPLDTDWNQIPDFKEKF